MKGDFSRLGPWPNDTVTGVWLQQGRPLLDADWNNLQAVLRRMAARTLEALLGGPAGPARDLGFEVKALPRLGLNADGATGQRLAFDRSSSLPFGGASAEAEIEDLESAADPALPWVLAHTDGLAFHERGDRPYVIEVDLETAPGAAGVILRRPGHVGVGLRGDGSLWVGSEASGLETARVASAGRDRRLALVYCGRRYRLFLNEDPMAEWRGAAAGERQGAVLTIGAEPDGTASLACRLDAVRLWRIRRRHGRPVCKLVADLDLGGIQGRQVPDRTGLGNGARVEGERPAQATLDLRLGTGRYLVGGVPLVNSRPTSLGLGQLSDMRGVGLVYLETGERAVGALEDPRLREVALGGPDTVIETRSTWRPGLVVRPDAEAAWAAFHELSAAGEGHAEFEHNASPAGNSLYRVEVHDAGWCHAWPLGSKARAAAWRIQTAAADRLIWPLGEAVPRPGAPLLAFCDGADPWMLRVVDGASALEVAVTGGPASWPADEVRILPLASFKWSPNNAAAAYGVARVTAIDDPRDGRLGRLQLTSAGFNGLDLDDGDWVELSGASDAERGRLYPIAAFDSGLMQVDLADWDDPPLREAHILRRWGPIARHAQDGAYPIVLSGGFTQLDADVSVRFDADARFAEGIAWTLPLRQAEDDDWTSSHRRTGWLAADGPARGFAPLALIRTGDTLEIEDLRRSFRDLPSLSSTEVARPPPPERRIDAAEASRWLSRHLPGTRLVGAGPAPPGFRAAGEVVCAGVPEAATWRVLHSAGWAPGGPGRAVFVGGGVIFVEDGRPGAWRWTERTRWTRLKDLPEARTGFALVAVGGGAAMVGGSTIRGDRLCDTVDILVPGGEWTRLACQATPGLRPGAAMLGSLLYVTGGLDDTGAPMSRCEAVDLRGGGTFDAGAMRQARADHGMAAIGETCWVFGGVAEDGREIAEAEAYDGALDRWRAIAPLKLPVVGPATAVIGAAVALAGGNRRDRPLDEAVSYDPAFDRWTALPRLPAGRRRMGIAAEPAGSSGEARLLLVGGDGTDGADMMELALGRRLSLWASEGDETWP